MKHLLIFTFSFLSFSLWSQNPKFPPGPEGWENDSTLVKFITALKTAAANKDVTTFVSMLDKNVMSSFDGENDVIGELCFDHCLGVWFLPEIDILADDATH